MIIVICSCLLKLFFGVVYDFVSKTLLLCLSYTNSLKLCIEEPCCEPSYQTFNLRAVSTKIIHYKSYNSPLRNSSAPHFLKKGVSLFWWDGMRDLYQDAILLYFIPLLFIALPKVFITSFMLAVVLKIVR